MDDSKPGNVYELIDEHFVIQEHQGIENTNFFLPLNQVRYEVSVGLLSERPLGGGWQSKNYDHYNARTFSTKLQVADNNLEIVFYSLTIFIALS